MKKYTPTITFLFVVAIISLIMTQFFGFTHKALAAGYLFSLILDRLDDIREYLKEIEKWQRNKN